MGNYTVHYYNLSGRIKGFTTRSGDDYAIVINANLNTEEQHKAFLHELKHIERGDLEREGCVAAIEGEVRNSLS